MQRRWYHLPRLIINGWSGHIWDNLRSIDNSRPNENHEVLLGFIVLFVTEQVSKQWQITQKRNLLRPLIVCRCQQPTENDHSGVGNDDIGSNFSHGSDDVRKSHLRNYVRDLLQNPQFDHFVGWIDLGGNAKFKANVSPTNGLKRPYGITLSGLFSAINEIPICCRSNK